MGDPSWIRTSGFWSHPALIAREPLVHFILLGILIVAIENYFEDRWQVERITITQNQIRLLADNYRLQHGEQPSSEQMRAMEDTFILQEIFYRQALKLGLDADDEIIRRRLVQKYEFLQQDLYIPPEPTETQLIEYYRRYADRYSQQETVTFTHRYFSPDRRGDNEARTMASELAASLNLKNPYIASDFGDPFPGDSNFTAVSRSDLARSFGQKGLTEQVFNLQSGRWIGPVRSGFGWHVVYITDHGWPQQRSYEQARDDVRRDYLETMREQHNAALLAKLRQEFRIVRE